MTLAAGGVDASPVSFVIPAGAADPYVNTATVSCSPLGSTNVYTAEASWSTNLFQPVIGLRKTGDALSKIGDEVGYVITLTIGSSGDTPEMTCTISDPTIGFTKTVTLASGGVDTVVRLGNVKSGVMERLLSGHTGQVFSVAFSPNGKLMASASWDSTIRLWDVASGFRSSMLAGHTAAVSQCEVQRPSGRVGVAAISGSFLALDFSRIRAESTLAHTPLTQAVGRSTDLKSFL